MSAQEKAALQLMFRKPMSEAEDLIERAITLMKEADVPQGLIVAVLHGMTHRETREMLFE